MTRVLPKADAYRRFGTLPLVDPQSVKGLPDAHPAIVEKRPLFTHRVMRAGQSPRILVSGVNNRKIGNEVQKGPWAGMPIYTVTLAERTTCSTECFMYSACFGNAMQWARRHLPGKDLEAAIEREVHDKAREHPKGFVLRLHVLGDFYSPEYALMWSNLLRDVPALHAFGYTSRLIDSTLPEDREIAGVISMLNNAYSDRWVIRSSRPNPVPLGATVLDHVPEGPWESGIVCPAETEKTACCSTCALCWSPGARDKTIGFIRHGKGSSTTNAAANTLSKVDDDQYRSISALHLPGLETSVPARGAPPVSVIVDPSDLHVDETYQRNLTRRSVKLIKSMVEGWDWSKFSPPSIARDEQGRLCVFDGQHTAIAALTRGEKELPCMEHEGLDLEARANSFVGRNRDRIAVTPTQIHHSAVVARDETALSIERVSKMSGVRILKSKPVSGGYQVGDTLAVRMIERSIRDYGERPTADALTILVDAGCAPIDAMYIRAVCYICCSEEYAFDIRRTDLVSVIKQYGDVLIEGAIERGNNADMPTWRGLVAELFHESQELRKDQKKLIAP